MKAFLISAERLHDAPGSPNHACTPVGCGEFIPIAEESALINPLGHFVLEQACADAQALTMSGMPCLELSVNLSFRQLERDSLVNEIATILDATSFDPTQLCLEVTESGLMRHHDQSVRILSGLKDLGCLPELPQTIPRRPDGGNRQCSRQCAAICWWWPKASRPKRKRS
jgi:sensor c-di-GMP phosphodiesterase-like protein